MPENIWKLRDNFDVFVFDVYGVIWDGRKVIDGYDKLMNNLREMGKKVLILSNGTELSSKSEDKFVSRGFVKGVHYDRLVTSGTVAKHHFDADKTPKKFYQFGRPNKDLFADCCYLEVRDAQEADFIYAGVPQTGEEGFWKDYLSMDIFREELKYLAETGKTLLCANPDKKAFENQYDQPVVRQGSVADVFMEYGGKVDFFGKPYPAVYEFALGDENIPRERMLMIGDTLETDILGGKTYGMKTALVQGGIASLNMHEAGMDDLSQYAAVMGIVPDYIV